jgi:hypothetical protein
MRVSVSGQCERGTSARISGGNNSKPAHKTRFGAAQLEVDLIIHPIVLKGLPRQLLPWATDDPYVVLVRTIVAAVQDPACEGR